MKQIFLSLCTLFFTTSSTLAGTLYSIESELDLNAPFASRSVVLSDGTIAITRQENYDYLFIKPDGSQYSFETKNSTPASYVYEKKDGSLVVIDGRDINTLDPQGNLIKSFNTQKPGYIWHAWGLEDGNYACLSNRMVKDPSGDEDPMGNFRIFSHDGTLLSEIDLGLDAIWSKPIVSEKHSTIAFKTQNGKLFLAGFDGKLKANPIFTGRRTLESISLHHSGQYISGGNFEDGTIRVLFIDPANGIVTTELKFNRDIANGSQDLLYATDLGRNTMVLSFVEYINDELGFHYHERLEFWTSELGSMKKISEFRIPDVGFDITWNASMLSDGTIVHGSGKNIFFFTADGNLLDTIEIPMYISGPPILFDKSGSRLAYVENRYDDQAGRFIHKLVYIKKN